MEFIKAVAVSLCLTLSSSAFSEQMYMPICYRNNASKSEIILLGTNHFLRYQPRPDGPVERMIEKSNLVLFENTEFLPKDGIFGEKMELPEDAKRPIRLDSIFEDKDIPEISKILGVKVPLDMQVPRSFVGIFIDSILNKKLQAIYGKEMSLVDRSAPLTGAYNTESAAYVYAHTKQVRVESLESVDEILGIPELKVLKSEVGALIECAKTEACVEKYKANYALIREQISGDSKYSYDDLSQTLLKMPGFARTTTMARNERMFKRMMSLLLRVKRALVLVGAAHIGGPVGLAEKLEAAKFEKVTCRF